MQDEQHELMMTIYHMTKGELVDIIIDLMDKYEHAADNVREERDKGWEMIDDLKNQVVAANQRADGWKADYQLLWDLVEAGATITHGMIDYDDVVKNRALDRCAERILLDDSTDQRSRGLIKAGWEKPYRAYLEEYRKERENA